MICICNNFQAIAPLGWRVTASMDVASKNLDNNDRYSYEGQSEDMHTWFFLYDDKLASKHDTTETHKQVKASKNYNVFQQLIFSTTILGAK